MFAKLMRHISLTLACGHIIREAFWLLGLSGCCGEGVEWVLRSPEQTHPRPDHKLMEICMVPFTHSAPLSEPLVSILCKLISVSLWVSLEPSDFNSRHCNVLSQYVYEENTLLAFMPPPSTPIRHIYTHGRQICTSTYIHRRSVLFIALDVQTPHLGVPCSRRFAY